MESERLPDYLWTKEYLEYIKKNCGVRGYDLDNRSEKCTRPDVGIALRYVSMMSIKTGEDILEVGCGLGRILRELYDLYCVSLYGCDMLPTMIREAHKRVGGITEALIGSKCENLPFKDESFHHIVCWGMFDLTEQTQSFVEMARVLKLGGKLLMTGKGDYYHLGDEEAKKAEEACKRLGIPNHFTDVEAMFKLAEFLGLSVVRQRFFLFRGDFMKDEGVDEMPKQFYEYLFIFRKGKGLGKPKIIDIQIGRKSSRTFRGEIHS